MENDLISRSILDAELIKAQESLESDDDSVWARNQGHHKGLAWARRITQDAPAIDAEPVVHGAWLPMIYRLAGGPTVGRRYTHYCSVCNQPGHPDYLGCPRCFARMDGGAE